MKLFLVAVLCFVQSVFGQVTVASYHGTVFASGIPRKNLAAAYDMVTISGSTLTDVSGHGKDGTISGAASVAAGLTLNGSSDFVGIPAEISNSDFTVLV